MTPSDPYQRLIDFLDAGEASYRLIDHEPEGRTDLVSSLRGNAVHDAAKCMVVMVKIGKKTKKYVLAVVPGDAKVDLTAVRNLFGGTYVSFATPEIAENLSGSVAGTILPFSFHPDLELIADPSIKEIPELYFNAARLDRSMALRTSDYLTLAQPRTEEIALYESAPDPRAD
ncbi:Ala-tRNA(Pro) deacylase [Nocardia tenerifensis]|uniref:Ala-tRNA(Pro) deacylase n=1 Tax=Nocardia tenerifensis TaxID=228006 RepID=A0A318K0I6_9NOCA|nr:YbaK/EbsC family protein [Nocardia tenerifensis]PXX61777.1 Ala-tRNA(Pro) deacylase [Nocardia tenerifensis]